jgi:hypothetical protein
MNLSDRALLVQLNISQWTARKYDKRATQEVADNHGTSMTAGRYNKSLLPMNEYLDRVHKKAGAIRTMYYQNTLPWGIEGTQMLPTSNYLNFMTEFRKQKSEWETLVNEFISEYTNLLVGAQRFLGTLYNPNDYPDRISIANKFKMDMAVFPVPSTDFRVQLSTAELSTIQRDVEQRLRDASQSAMKDVWNRLFERVQHMADKLADPNGIFRDSMIENAREICALLPRLNFSDDADLEAMRMEVETKIARFHPDALRNDPDLRRDTAAEAKAIMDKMSVFMSGM